jgi:hypothetical protein
MRFIAISSLSLPEIRRRSVGLLPSKRRVVEARSVVPTKAFREASMSRHRRLKIEGGTFSTRLRSPGHGHLPGRAQMSWEKGSTGNGLRHLTTQNWKFRRRGRNFLTARKQQHLPQLRRRNGTELEEISWATPPR